MALLLAASLSFLATCHLAMSMQKFHVRLRELAEKWLGGMHLVCASLLIVAHRLSSDFNSNMCKVGTSNGTTLAALEEKCKQATTGSFWFLDSLPCRPTLLLFLETNYVLSGPTLFQGKDVRQPVGQYDCSVLPASESNWMNAKSYCDTYTVHIQ
ncbi:hypothetical protein BDR05DRAFT_958469 [Suillus weaverae]|nr:hypothetical protein BDR05DRAFT_958469 [Suillus weaverae]